MMVMSKVLSRSYQIRLYQNLLIKTNVYSSRGLIDENLFEGNCEIRVLEFINKLEKAKGLNILTYDYLLELYEKNIKVLEELFDNKNGVLIMSDNPKIRINRLNILSLLRNYSLLLADFTLLNS